MSKYNNMKSIKVAEVPKNEIKQAIKEWAEGLDSMEELLTLCMENNVETCGCHAGSYPYIDIMVNDSYEKVRNMIYSIQNIDGLRLLVMPDGGNPRSSDDFYKASITISFQNVTKKLDADNVFNKLNESFKISNSYKGTFDIILDFYKFFEEKESGLKFRAYYIDNKYTFTIDLIGKYNFEYFTNLFEKCKLERIETEYPLLNRWRFTLQDPTEFRNRMEECYKLIISNWTLDIPNEIHENMTLDAKARIKRRQLINKPNGMEEFRNWVKEEFNFKK